MNKVGYFLTLSMLSSVMLTGCGNSTETVSRDTDNCIVVQTPADSTVEGLFDFKHKQQLALSTWGNDASSSTVYNICELEDGNSIVWQSEDVFLYVPGVASDRSILHYKDRLQDTPISYEDFENQRNNE